MPRIDIFQAGAADVERIAPLFDAYRVFYALPTDIGAAWRFLRDRLARGESIVFYAADSDGAAVGFVQLYPLFSSLALRRAYVLNDLYVAPAARRAGAARALLARAEGFARENDARYLALQTAAGNDAARSLYESAGYRRESAFEHYELALE